MSKVIKLIQSSKPVSLEDIISDLNNNLMDCLYFVNKEQIEEIDALERYDDLISNWLDYQEEIQELRNAIRR
jgi:hypothetical protein